MQDSCIRDGGNGGSPTFSHESTTRIATTWRSRSQRLSVPSIH